MPPDGTFSGPPISGSCATAPARNVPGLPENVSIAPGQDDVLPPTQLGPGTVVKTVADATPVVRAVPIMMLRRNLFILVLSIKYPTRLLRGVSTVERLAAFPQSLRNSEEFLGISGGTPGRGNSGTGEFRDGNSGTGNSGTGSESVGDRFSGVQRATL